MVSGYFFVELSPIQIPFHFLPKRKKLVLDKDLGFWVVTFVAFILLCLLVFSQVKKDFKISVSSDSLETKNSVF